MPRPLLIISQSVCLTKVVDTNSHTKGQTVQIQISWLLQKPIDLDLHCLQRQGISGFSRSRVKYHENMYLLINGRYKQAEKLQLKMVTEFSTSRF